MLFCLLLILLHFLMIEERNISDRMLFAVICIAIIGTLMLYIYLSYHANDVVRYAWDESHALHNYWKEEHDEKCDIKEKKKSLYRTAEQFRSVLSYYIYPRKSSLPYSFVIAAGYFFGLCLTNEKFKFGSLFLIWWIFEFSFCQARYMLNDIRGLKEDIIEYNTLFTDKDDNKNHRNIHVKRKLGSLVVREISLRIKIKQEAKLENESKEVLERERKNVEKIQAVGMER